MAEAGYKRVSAVVSGRVQGVGFRQFVYEEARRLGLRGYVRNDRRDREKLEVVAEGLQSKLEELERRLWAGPVGARVTAVTLAWVEAIGLYEHFEISY